MVEKRPRVLVLLCTFNGEKFLSQQLNSIFHQKDVEVQVIANDDGSTDGTVKILESWELQGLVSKILHTDRVGSTKGFQYLAKTVVTENVDYFAFSDQDDIWYESKLSKQIDSFRLSDVVMVTSPRDIVDKNGKLIRKSRKFAKDLSWRNAVIENCAPGNTQLISKQGLLLLQDLPAETKYFDSMAFLFLTTFGKVTVTLDPVLAYRIHENNQIGRSMRRNYLQKFFSFFDFLFQAQQFLEFNPDNIPKEMIGSIETLIGIRPYNLFRMGFPSNIAYRQNFFDNFLFSVYLFFPKAIKNWIYCRVRSNRK